VNRQLRRANERSDRRREREQERRKEARRAARTVPAPRQRAAAAPEAAPKTRPAPGTLRQGLSLAYLVLVVGILLAQAFVPQQTDPFSLFVHALFYIIFGYFLALQLFRRGVARAGAVTVLAGALLAALIEAAKLLTRAGAPEPVLVALALPGLVLGAWLGGFVNRQEAR
jgi:VanZ family protein